MSRAGPTRATAATTSSAWTSRPALARALRITAALLPTAVSFFVTYGLVQQLPPHETGLPNAVWWLALFAIGTVVLVATDKVARRLLPLVALFKLSLVFPDQAPSRYAIALKTGTTKQLERRITELKRDGIPNDEAQFATIMLELVASLSVHDRMTRGHCERVRAYTDLVIEELGIHEPDASRLRWAALLHDVGKLFVDPAILNSPDRPTNEQWEELKSHTWQGDKLIGPLKPWLGEWHRAVGEHHERWDGDGYPNGLAGTDIHLGARIVAVADAFDVMTSARSYKKPIPAEEARAEIARCAGGQFDPKVVRAFLNIGLGQLRLAIGPLAWLANIPAAAQASLAPALSPMATGATAAATVAMATVSGGFGGAFVPDSEPPEALALVTEQSTDESEFATVTLDAPTTTTVVVTTTVPTTSAPPSPPPSEPRTTTTRPAPTTAPAEERQPPAPPPDPAPMAFALVRTISEDGGPVVLSITATSRGDLDWRIIAEPTKGIGTLTPPPTVGAESAAPTDRFAEITYEPGRDEFGTDELVFEVCDDQQRCDTAGVTLTITPVPDAPVAATDVLPAVTEDTVTDFASARFLGNDTDADGDVLTITSVEVLGAGSAVILADGAIVRYTPAPDDDGDDIIRYEVCDPTGLCDTALALIDLLPVPDHPRPAPDVVSTLEHTPITVSLATLLANDYDPDGEPLEIRDATTARGTVMLDTNAGTLTYTPHPNDDTQQTVSYEVCDPTDRCAIGTLFVDIIAVVDHPIPNDDTASTPEDTELRVPLATLLANDTHDENKAMTVVSATVVAGSGTVSMTDSELVYVPAPDDDTEAAIDYEVCDVDNACATGRLTVDILPVNDPPVVDQTADQDNEPGNEIAIAITANDVEGHPFVFQATGLPPGLSIDEHTGLISGTLTAAAAGETHTISVTAVEKSPNDLVSEPMVFDLKVDLGNDLSPLTRSLIISEVLHRSSSGVHDEFVEITNVGDEPVDLAGLQVLDHEPGRMPILGWARTLGTTDSRGTPSVLAVGQSAVVWVNNPLQTDRSFPDAPTEALTYRGPSAGLLYLGLLADSGDDIWLVDADERIIDYVAFESPPPASGSEVLQDPPDHQWIGDEPHDLASAAAGQSISLAVPGRNDDPGCWERTGSGDAVGRCAGATATQQSNSVAGDVRIASIGQANFQ